VSLIELLIGIAIGLLVVVAAIGSLVYTRTSSTAVGDSTRLQQDASTAFRALGHHVRQGGARRIIAPLPGSANVEFNTAYNGFGVNANTASTYVVQGADGAANAPDILQVSHDTDPVVQSMDCLGAPSLVANNVQSTFSVAGNALQCLGSGAVTPFALLQGVEDFQVWYGFRTGDNLQYRTATAISLVVPTPWDQVETIQVCIRLAGELSNNPGVDVTGCNGENIANDGRIRRVFFRVFKIRNQGL
jgi:type IV pilus assembly protein PilW